ncbi:hypothetical protein BURMUCF2_A0855 [Burkholderia multivorans CF2]|nr:hypothetical protein BURMUCF2_A0855 [Burkholderia multivorans CF2]
MYRQNTNWSLYSTKTNDSLSDPSAWRDETKRRATVRGRLSAQPSWRQRAMAA